MRLFHRKRRPAEDPECRRLRLDAKEKLDLSIALSFTAERALSQGKPVGCDEVAEFLRAQRAAMEAIDDYTAEATVKGELPRLVASRHQSV